MADIKYISEITLVEKGIPTLQKPFIVSGYADKTLARAYLGTSQTGLTSASATKVLLDTESFDVDNNFASYKYTAPVTGYYQVNWSIYIRGDGGVLTTGNSYIYVDGVALRYGAGITGADIVSTGADMLYLTAGQYLELYANATTASSTWKIQSSNPGTFMSVYLVSTS